MYQDDWEPVKGFPDYIVSDSGRVMSYKWERWHEIFPFCSQKGYLYTNLGRSKRQSIHKLVAEAFIENPNNLSCINHLDGDKQNNNASNLEWCSYSENNQHAYDSGLRTTNKRVRIIETGEEFISQSACARHLNVGQQYLNRRVRGTVQSQDGLHFEEI